MSNGNLMLHDLRALSVIIRLNLRVIGWRAAYECCCCRELWDGIISFPLAKNGRVYPMQKDIRKEALSHLSLAFRQFGQLLSWTTSTSFHSVRNLPKQKGLFDHGPRLMSRAWWRWFAGALPGSSSHQKHHAQPLLNRQEPNTLHSPKNTTKFHNHHMTVLKPLRSPVACFCTM